MPPCLRPAALTIGLAVGLPAPGHQDVSILNLSGVEWVLRLQRWDARPLQLALTRDGPGAFRGSGSLDLDNELRIPHQGFVTLGVKDPAERRGAWILATGFHGRVTLGLKYDPWNPSPAEPRDRQFGRLEWVPLAIPEPRPGRIVQSLGASTIYLGEGPGTPTDTPTPARVEDDLATLEAIQASEQHPDAEPLPDSPLFSEFEPLDDQESRAWNAG